MLFPDGPQPSQYVVRPPGAVSDIAQQGRHPLVRSLADSLGISWHVIVRTDVVDATAAQPLLLNSLNLLRTTGPRTSVRILARTDGKLPLHYICATPPACASAPVTDVLCFLSPPQKAPVDADTEQARRSFSPRAGMTTRSRRPPATTSHLGSRSPG